MKFEGTGRDLLDTHKRLRDEFEKRQALHIQAQESYRKAQAVICDFEARYYRVIALLNEEN